MQGMHFKSGPFNIRIEMDDAEIIIARRHLEKGGEVQKYIDNEVVRLSKPFVPFLAGQLAKSAENHSDIGSGEVKWATPYARYQYYGKLMVGPAPKTLTDKNLKQHTQGTKPKWFERMKAAHGKDILQGAAKLAGGKAE